MKKLFYIGALGLILFEIANIYFIMPLPGSQEINSLGFAYFFHTYRWFFRLLFLGMVVYGFKSSYTSSKPLTIVTVLLCAFGFYAANFQMSAERMFYQPTDLQLSNVINNKVDLNRTVIGISYNGESKAYPIQYLGYHHQVQDNVGGKRVMVTYCTVCRTGRVYEPIVNGKPETFRLVGMDHFNALFEDATTESWWRQANGKAVAGPLIGHSLPEFPFSQVTLAQWLELHPNSKIMQADDAYKQEYEDLKEYENGTKQGQLTKRDPRSWQKKSWIIGIEVGDKSKAYDWNRLTKERIIYDVVNTKPIVLILADDNKSFVVFYRKTVGQEFSLDKGVIQTSDKKYRFDGRPITKNETGLIPVKAYQEYWHSWKTFHPETEQDDNQD
jgi:hypothetical protein